MRPLEFGIFDPTAIPDDQGPGITAAAYEAHLADAQMAERLGYDYFFFIEHQNAGFACISAPTVYLAALARATRSLRIGAMIFQLPLHHPIRLAQDIAMIDHLSRGRVEFAFGYGTRTREFEPWKVPFNERRTMGQEAMEIVLKAWSGRVVTHHGAFWTVDKATPQPRPHQQPHPPIWLGAHSHASFDYAAARNFNVAQIFQVEAAVIEKFTYFRAAWRACRHPGPRPRTLLVRHVHIAATDRAARAQAEPFMLKGIQGPAGVERALKLRPEEATAEMRELARVYHDTSTSVEFWVDEGLAFIGSPDTVAAAIDAQRQRVGYDILLLNHQFVDMPREMYTASMRLFGETVIPALGGPGLALAVASA